jgi:DNA ligase (NAD+)
MASLEEVPEQGSGVFAGKTIVVTGTLVQYTRNEVKQLIERQGGRAASGVSGKTDYLLAGEQAGSKLARAEELGVQVITEDQFADLLKAEMS